MKEFRVEFETRMTTTFVIEADSEDEAREAAENMGYSDLEWEDSGSSPRITDISEV